MDTPGPSSILALILLIAFSAFFSAVETALNSINRIRLKHRAEDGDKRAAQVLAQAEDYDRTLSTILVGNNVVNLSMSSLATVVFTQILGANLGPTVSTVVITVLVLIFGEILPKSYAKANAEKVSTAAAPLLGLFRILLTPVVALFSLIQRMANRKSAEDTPTVTEDELKTFIDTVEEEGVLDAQESDIIQSVIELEETTVQDVLVPRVDMVALELGADRKTIMDTVLGCPYTRIPLYEGTVDHCVGMLHTRDLLSCLASGEPVELRRLRRDILTVYRTKRLNDLLTEFRSTKHHMAVVADDHGGTLGIVTLEDVLEELVGEIFDETDSTEPMDVTRLAPGLFRVEGDTNVEDMFEAIGFRLPKDAPEGDYTSAAGWALASLGHIPEAGEGFRFYGIHATVGQMDGKRIASLVVRI